MTEHRRPLLPGQIVGTPGPYVPPPVPPALDQGNPQSKLYVGPDVKRFVPQWSNWLKAATDQAKADAAAAAIMVQPAPAIATWSIDNLFRPQTKPGAAPNKKPVSDAFTLYLLATMCRMGYTRDDAAYQQLQKALPGWSYSRTGDIGGQNADYDLWYDTTGKKRIVVYCGTTTFDEAVSYLPGGLTSIDFTDGPLNGVLEYTSLYKLGMVQDQNTLTLFPSKTVEDGLTVLTGHSAGGAIAQHVATKVNKQFTNAPQWITKPVCGVYTFGSPAAFYVPPTGIGDGSFGGNHVRTVITGDPVPDSARIQQALDVAVRASTPFSYNLMGKVPQLVDHADVDVVRLGLPPAAKVQSVAQQAMAAIASGGRVFLESVLVYHAVSSYCNLLETLMRKIGDLPPEAGAVISTNRYLDSVSK